MLTFRGCPLFFAEVPQELLPELSLAFCLLGGVLLGVARL